MNQLFVIKIGGNVLDDESALHRFLQQLAQLPHSPKILVHGGGKIATRLGDKLGITSNYINGRRITDDATIDLVTMVYGGLVNKQLVARLQSLNVNALGFTGADGNVMPAVKRPVKEIDYGWVGDIESSGVNTSLLISLLQQNIMPVFAPLTHDSEGHILNTNADTIAATLAIALSAYYNTRLIYCFEKRGVLLDIEHEDSSIPVLYPHTYGKLKQEGKLFAGILPKLDNAFAACHAGVAEVLIGHADQLLQNTTLNPAGTLITLNPAL